jgi:hypothetical protein
MAAKKKNPTSLAKAGKTPKSEKAGQSARANAKAAQSAEDRGQPKLSALDAAAKILGETGQAMTCRELIEAMAAKSYWTSPAGRTPQATLYAALAREIQTKKDQARFRKSARGKFALA